jgi:hypothetical protein
VLAARSVGRSVRRANGCAPHPRLAFLRRGRTMKSQPNRSPTLKSPRCGNVLVLARSRCPRRRPASLTVIACLMLAPWPLPLGLPRWRSRCPRGRVGYLHVRGFAKQGRDNDPAGRIRRAKAAAARLALYSRRVRPFLAHIGHVEADSGSTTTRAGVDWKPACLSYSRSPLSTSRA